VEDAHKFWLAQLYQNCVGGWPPGACKSTPGLFYPGDAALSEAARQAAAGHPGISPNWGSGYPGWRCATWKSTRRRQSAWVEQSGTQMGKTIGSISTWRAAGIPRRNPGPDIPGRGRTPRSTYRSPAFIPGRVDHRSRREMAAYPRPPAACAARANCWSSRRLDRPLRRPPAPREQPAAGWKLKLIAKRCGFSRIKTRKKPKSGCIENPMEEPPSRLAGARVCLTPAWPAGVPRRAAARPQVLGAWPQCVLPPTSSSKP